MLGVRTVYTALGTWNKNSATATCSRMLFIWPSVPVEGYIHTAEYWMVIVEIRPQKHDGSLLPAISCNICVYPSSNCPRLLTVPEMAEEFRMKQECVYRCGLNYT